MLGMKEKWALIRQYLRMRRQAILLSRMSSRMKRMQRNLRDSPVRGWQPLSYPKSIISNIPLTPAWKNQHTHADIWLSKLDKAIFQPGHCVVCIFSIVHSSIPFLSLFCHFFSLLSNHKTIYSYCRKIKSQFQMSLRPGWVRTQGLTRTARLHPILFPNCFCQRQCTKSKYQWRHDHLFILGPNRLMTKFLSTWLFFWYLFKSK